MLVRKDGAKLVEPFGRSSSAARKIAGDRVAARVAAMVLAARRVIQAVKILARDGRIPKPLRGLVAFGVLPIPGPVDEVVLLIVGPILWALYRDRFREAWNQAAHAEGS